MREDWIEVELGKVLIIERGGSPRPIKEYITDSVDGINWIKIGDTQIHSKYIKQTSEKIKPEGIKKTRLVKKGDLLLSNSMSFGRPYILDIDGAIHDGWLVLKNATDFKVESEYLYYVLSSPNIFAQFDKLATGSTVRNLNKDLVSSVTAPIPPLPIQRAIVQKIESYFELLDKGIADLKTAQEQLKIYRQAVLKKAFEGGFTNKNVKEGELPEGWKLVKLREVAEINPKLPNKEEINSSLEIQFLPMKLVEEEINKIHLIETRLFHEVQKGSYTPFIENDIIFAKVTPCMENGKIAITKNLKNGIGYGSSEFHVIRCIGEILNTYIFHYVVQSRFRKEAENQMTGAVGLRRVPKKFLENYFIPFPPTLSEQHAIVREIESRLSVCDKVEENINESLEKAEALRQSILKKAFDGRLLSGAEVTACKQEADYEPASVLLEKIKKEKK